MVVTSPTISPLEFFSFELVVDRAGLGDLYPLWPDGSRVDGGKGHKVSVACTKTETLSLVLFDEARIGDAGQDIPDEKKGRLYCFEIMDLLCKFGGNKIKNPKTISRYLGRLKDAARKALAQSGLSVDLVLFESSSSLGIRLDARVTLKITYNGPPLLPPGPIR